MMTTKTKKIIHHKPIFTNAIDDFVLLLTYKLLDLFQPKTSTFSTRALIWVHLQTAH